MKVVLSYVITTVLGKSVKQSWKFSNGKRTAASTPSVDLVSGIEFSRFINKIGMELDFWDLRLFVSICGIMIKLKGKNPKWEL